MKRCSNFFRVDLLGVLPTVAIIGVLAYVMTRMGASMGGGGGGKGSSGVLIYLFGIIFVDEKYFLYWKIKC